MSNKRQMSLRNKANTAIERIAKMETDLKHVVNAINRHIDQVAQELTFQRERLEVLMEDAGVDEVEARVAERQAEALEEQAKQMEEAIAEGIKEGFLVAGEQVEESSLLLLQEFDKEGEVLPPGRTQVAMAQLRGVNPQAYEDLLGQEKGFSMENPIGGTVKILAIYNVVEQEPEDEATEEEAPDLEPESDDSADETSESKE